MVADAGSRQTPPVSSVHFSATASRATGSKQEFKSLTEDHQNMCYVVEQAILSEKLIGPGSISQDDSRKVRSLQAADIAAGIAREIFEINYPDVQKACRAVKSNFARVLLNTRWLK